MTAPDDNQGVTRPISVAELLARNGTIGAPPVGGRRRRRRGNSDSVTVAELTGEIPIVRPTGELPVVAAIPEPEPATDPEPEPEAELDPEPEPPVADDSVAQSDTETNGSAVVVDEDVPVDPAPVPQLSGLRRAADPIPRRGRNAPPERSPNPLPARASVVPAAEQMSPDPVDANGAVASDALDVTADDSLDVVPSDEVDVQPDEFGLLSVNYDDNDDGALFGGDTIADEMARNVGSTGSRSDAVAETAVALDEAGGDDSDDDYAAPSRGRQILHGLIIAVESVLAVAFGAGLFLAFDQLWKWNSLIAMLLAILATLGLVAGVWVVRKTEDIASTLIAVGVGLLVTFGPLALMHAN